MPSFRSPEYHQTVSNILSPLFYNASTTEYRTSQSPYQFCISNCCAFGSNCHSQSHEDFSCFSHLSLRHDFGYSDDSWSPCSSTQSTSDHWSKFFPSLSSSDFTWLSAERRSPCTLMKAQIGFQNYWSTCIKRVHTNGTVTIRRNPTMLPSATFIVFDLSAWLTVFPGNGT